jgi:hypothetical protein
MYANKVVEFGRGIEESAGVRNKKIQLLELHKWFIEINKTLGSINSE